MSTRLPTPPKLQSITEYEGHTMCFSFDQKDLGFGHFIEDICLTPECHYAQEITVLGKFGGIDENPK